MQLFWPQCLDRTRFSPLQSTPWFQTVLDLALAALGAKKQQEGQIWIGLYFHAIFYSILRYFMFSYVNHRISFCITSFVRLRKFIKAPLFQRHQAKIWQVYFFQHFFIYVAESLHLINNWVSLYHNGPNRCKYRYLYHSLSVIIRFIQAISSAICLLSTIIIARPQSVQGYVVRLSYFVRFTNPGES